MEGVEAGRKRLVCLVGKGLLNYPSERYHHVASLLFVANQALRHRFLSCRVRLWSSKSAILFYELAAFILHLLQ